MFCLNAYNNPYTDKGTSHSYLELYNRWFHQRQYSAQHIMEIGVNFGGSIKLWHDYFPNSTIYGVDIEFNHVWDEIQNKSRIQLYQSDAYSSEFAKYICEKVKSFDIIIDDGPHTLETMKRAIELYVPYLSKNGIFIIEDIPSWEWMEELRQMVPDELRKYIGMYDLRPLKGRFDDIVFVVNLGPDIT